MRPSFESPPNLGGDVEKKGYLPPFWLKASLFGVAYCLCAWCGRFLSADGSVFVSFWLPGGLYVAVLMLAPTERWLGYMIGALAANLLFDLPHGSRLPTVLGFYLANTTQAALGAWLTRRFVTPFPSLSSLREFGGLVLFAVVVGASAAATIGAATLAFSGLSGDFGGSWRNWWASNGMAIFVVVPFVLTFFSGRRTGQALFQDRRRIVEGLALLAGMAGGAFYTLVLGGGINSPNKSLLMPFMIWAGLRFGVRGASLASLVLALLLGFFTTRYLKGLTEVEVASGAYTLTTQVFAAMCVVVGLVPAIVVEERDQKVRELLESEERFRNLTAAAFEAVVISCNGRILDVNERCLQMFGWSREEMVGKAVVDLVSPQTRGLVAEAIEAERDSVYEHKLLRKDGSHFLGEVRARMMRSGDRTLRLTAIQDISERREAEEALKRSEERLRIMVENAPEAIVVLDVERGVFEHFNENACRLFATTREQLMQLNPAVLSPAIQPDGRSSAETIIQNVQQALQGRAFHFEWMHQSTNGEEIPCEVHLSRFPSESRRLVRGSIIDLRLKKRAEQKAQRLEEELRQAHKMEALGTLAGGTAHEFNNILGIVTAYTESSLAELGSHPVRDHLKEILGASQRAKEIIQQILTFSRQQKQEKRLVNLQPLIEEAVKVVRTVAPSNVSVETQLPSEPVAVLANSTQLHQVFTNICNNAFHALEGRGGTIRITLTVIQLADSEIHHSLKQGPHALISIADNGVGMDESTIARIFEPFFTTKNQGEGTGLGLAVVHGIIQAHEGVVVVRSRPGQGSIFDLYFPALPGVPHVEPIEKPSARGVLGKGRILVVDDEIPLANVMKIMLERDGHMVAVANSAGRALELLENCSPEFDLVITDLTMPGISGLQLAEAVHAKWPALPIILATGFDGVRSDEGVNTPAIRTVLQKPFSTEELTSLVDATIHFVRTTSGGPVC